MTNLWYFDITRWSDIVTEQERSLAISSRHRPSHTIGKAETVSTVASQARRY